MKRVVFHLNSFGAALFFKSRARQIKLADVLAAKLQRPLRNVCTDHKRIISVSFNLYFWRDFGKQDFQSIIDLIAYPRRNGTSDIFNFITLRNPEMLLRRKRCSLT